ncbi:MULTISPECIES: LytR C-terminal domain-containing protein [unclassified Janthinobacterium]|uniref:LytR C-terminal domain-containing protein n=1 Tax=unclassified Janthinobacterium TaxID=2610881 RepID=UPI00034B7A36|nr:MULTISPECIES: tetratricopeptide repeat protein [unclassified Janthinobacterium]MEC5158925.1 Tfp pilus assembly protein PilF [Janthinobacterium sp. CG_S6]
MHTTPLTRLAAACATVLLAACAGGGQAPAGAPFAPAPVQSVQSAQLADGYYALGRKQHAARRDADAARAYQLALQFDPGHVNAGNALAVLAAAQGDYGRAIALWQDLTRAGAAAPRSAFLFANLGYAYFLGGDNERALAALEQACVLDPSNARSWEHLGAVLAKIGQAERAALMLAQAASLRTHKAGDDYALLRRHGVGAAPAAAPARQAERADAGSDALARTELVASGDVLQLRRVAAPAVTAEAAPAPPPLAHGAPRPAPLLLEIRNGNGVTGMAAALGRTLASEQLRVVRLGNDASFRVARSRVEYRPDMAAQARALAARLGPLVLLEQASCGAADLRVVLGRDLLDAAALQRRYGKAAKLARLEPGKLG